MQGAWALNAQAMDWNSQPMQGAYMLILRALPLIHVLPSLSASPPSLGYVWLPTFPLTPHLPPPSALYGYSSQAPASETDLFTCRAVLQTLATANKASAPRQLAHAADLLEACVAFGNPELEASPLMRFCSLLVEVREPKWGEGTCLPLVPVAVRQGLPSSGLVPKSAPSLSAFHCHRSVAPPSPLHTHTLGLPLPPSLFPTRPLVDGLRPSRHC